MISETQLLVKKIYLDMDGVLVDLDGYLSERSCYPKEELLKNRRDRLELILASIEENSVAHWMFLPTQEYLFFRNLIQYFATRGLRVEILTSYGVENSADFGATCHQGKALWLKKYYGDLFKNGMISKFNGVQTCEQKSLYARPDSLLIDDQPENVQNFLENGGDAILFTGNLQNLKFELNKRGL